MAIGRVRPFRCSTINDARLLCRVDANIPQFVQIKCSKKSKRGKKSLNVVPICSVFRAEL